VTLDDVASRLGCSRRTVFRLLAEHAFPSIKLGRRRLIHPDDVDAYVQQLRST
jgi:excisionase family DNA binding protein